MFDFYPQLKQRFDALRTRAEFFRYVMCASPGNTCRYASMSQSRLLSITTKAQC